MAHLALPNSELHHGVSFTDHPRVQALAADARAAVLFPGAGAAPPEAFADGPPTTLVVIDGTWVQARKVLARTPALAALPRIGLTPARPGAYRIRREPAAHCLSTIEAVTLVLGALEGGGDRFRPMLAAFAQLVETQEACAAASPLPYVHEHRRLMSAPSPLVSGRDHLVLVQGEANAHPASTGVPGAAELVHLVALRPATGARFVAMIAPRRPLAPGTPRHLELPAGGLERGEPLATALARWRAFVTSADLLSTGGTHTTELLRAEGEPAHAAFDLRAAVARRLGYGAGGVEQAARLLGAPDVAPAWTPGRAGRRIAALAAVVRHLAPGPPVAAAS
jgi:hypothetical protein